MHCTCWLPGLLETKSLIIPLLRLATQHIGSARKCLFDTKEKKIRFTRVQHYTVYYNGIFPLMMMFEHRNVGIKNLKNVFDPSTVLRYPNVNMRISNYGVHNGYLIMAL